MSNSCYGKYPLNSHIAKDIIEDKSPLVDKETDAKNSEHYQKYRGDKFAPPDETSSMAGNAGSQAGSGDEGDKGKEKE